MEEIHIHNFFSFQKKYAELKEHVFFVFFCTRDIGNNAKFKTQKDMMLLKL